MHIISGNLRKAPYIKSGVGQDGGSTLFIVELSEVIKDRRTGEKAYTNYSAAIFAKGGQVDFYNNVLVEGNFIVVSGEKLLVKVSDCGQYTKLDLQNARLINAGYTGNNAAPQQNQGSYGQQPAQQATQQNSYGQQPQQKQRTAPQAPQQSYQQPAPQPRQPAQQQAPQQRSAPQAQAPSMDSFDDDIPFN